MNSKRSTPILFLAAFATSLLLAATFVANDARACSCVASTPEERLRMSDAVFSGEVADIDNSPGDGPSGRPTPLGRINFEVEETWKGDPEEQAVVRGYGPGPSCGIEAREGERYLVYARYGGEDGDGPLETTTCDGTKPLSAAQEDLRALESTETTLPASGGPALPGGRVVATTMAALLGLVGAVVLLRVPRRRGSA